MDPTDLPTFSHPQKFLVRGSDIKIWMSYGAYNGWKGEPKPMFRPVPMPSLAFRLDGGPTTTFGADVTKRKADGTIGFYGLKPGMHRIELGIVVNGHPQRLYAYCIRTPANFTATGY